MKILKGSSRCVILTRNFAIKIPLFTHYINFLWGLIANTNEIKFYKLLKDKRLCPILFSLPFGLMLVMPRIRTMSENDFGNFQYISFISREPIIPCEGKRDSFGYYKNNIVVVDYGS